MSYNYWDEGTNSQSTYLNNELSQQYIRYTPNTQEGFNQNGSQYKVKRHVKSRAKRSWRLTTESDSDSNYKKFWKNSFCQDYKPNYHKDSCKTYPVKEADDSFEYEDTWDDTQHDQSDDSFYSEPTTKNIYRISPHMLNGKLHKVENQCVGSSHNSRETKVNWTEKQEFVDTVTPQVLFSGPDIKTGDKIRYELTKVLLSAKKSIRIWNYSVGDGVLTPELVSIIKKKIEKSQQGDYILYPYESSNCADLRLLTDNNQMSSKRMEKYCTALQIAGVSIKTNISKHNFMHCKFMVIDDLVLVHGSMNLGQKSLKNFEHLEITFNKTLINKFTQRFDNMWNNQSKFSDFDAKNEKEQIEQEYRVWANVIKSMPIFDFN